VQRSLTSAPRGVAGRPHSLAGPPHFVASHGLASRAHSLGGSNKESEARSQWKPDPVAAQPRGSAGQPTPGELPT
jgi:hypothetical protein